MKLTLQQMHELSKEMHGLVIVDQDGTVYSNETNEIVGSIRKIEKSEAQEGLREGSLHRFNPQAVRGGLIYDGYAGNDWSIKFIRGNDEAIRIAREAYKIVNGRYPDEERKGGNDGGLQPV